MRKRRIWRVLLASAVIGLVEAAGLDRRSRLLRRPLHMVRLDDRERPDPLAAAGVWFLDPIPDPRPRPGDLRRATGQFLRLAAFRPQRPRT